MEHPDQEPSSLSNRLEAAEAQSNSPTQAAPPDDSVTTAQADDSVTVAQADSSVTASPALGSRIPLVAGDLIDGRFKIISTIGQGGMGSVYKVEQVYLHKTCALKVLAADKYSETAVRRFQKEAQAIARLNHENLVKAYDFGMIDENRAFFTMDLIEGRSLAQRLKTDGTLTVEDAISIFIPLSFALDYAHKEGIIHRDIKPGNILLERSGNQDIPKLVDFGIAKLQHSDEEVQALTRTGEIFGTPLYMSPEQCLGLRVDHRSDIYSLGCVLFECLTSTPPFLGDNALSTMLQHQSHSVPSLKEATLGKEFPPDLERVIAGCLEKDPEKRYQSMNDLANALMSVKTGTAALPPPQPAAQSQPGSDSRKLLLMGLASIVCTAVGGVLLYQYFQQPAPVSEAIKQPLVIFAPAPPTSTPGRRSGGDSSVDQDDRSGDMTVFLTKVGHSAPVIDAKHTELRDEDLLELKKDRRLVGLHLDYTKVTDKGMKTIAQLDSLRRLYLEYTRITNKGISYLSALKNLNVLHVSGNKLDDGCIPYLAKLRNLEDLAIREAQITDAGISKLSGLKKLRFLQINGTQITDDGIRAIVEMFPRLEVLHARYQNKITNKSLKYLEKAKHLKQLTLTNCDIDIKEIRHFYDTHPQVEEVMSSSERMFLKFTDPEAKLITK